MSDEPQNDKTEDEVEGHVSRAGINDEPATDDGDDEVEGHMSRSGAPRLDAPRLD